MGGVDKGLQAFHGVPLMLHAMQRIAPQVHQVMINANRNLVAYKAFGTEVFPDHDSEFSGPLSGFIVGLTHCKTPYLLTVPCDTPFFPLDLASRLLGQLQTHHADIAMAAQAGSAQPVFCLIKKELLASLLRFMESGGRKVGAWATTQKTILVDFDAPSDSPQAFANANTTDELSALEQAPAPKPN
jgi:molybdopterin-guanine dinucleotide biosynthesis protein A